MCSGKKGDRVFTGTKQKMKVKLAAARTHPCVDDPKKGTKVLPAELLHSILLRLLTSICIQLTVTVKYTMYHHQAHTVIHFMKYRGSHLLNAPANAAIIWKQ